MSNDSCNRYGSRVVVLPLTSHVDSLYPGEALAEDLPAIEEALLITLGIGRS